MLVQKSFDNNVMMLCTIAWLLASCNDLINASISNAAFLRFSLDRSPNDRCTMGGNGDSIDTL